MPIYYPDILDQRTPARTFTYGDKDVMLYALGVGMGRDYTIFATCDGVVKFEKYTRKNRVQTRVNVVPKA